MLGHICRFRGQRASVFHILNGAPESRRSRTEMAVSCVRGHRVFRGPAPHVAQSGMAMEEASTTFSGFLGPLLKDSRKLPDSHLPGPCELTVEMQWDEGCCWDTFRDREYLWNGHQLLTALVPRT